MLTRDVTKRNYDVQAFTGYPVSNVSAGHWVRGDIVRMDQPMFRTSTWDLYNYDPTNPLTWNNANF